MRPAKKHRITAAFFDLFVVGSLVQILGTLIVSITSPTSSLYVSLPMVVVYILAVIVYHTTLARRASFCSPGELIAGCRVSPEGKAWFSPFTRSRWFLFLTLFFLLLIPANVFDDMQRSGEYPLPVVVGRSFQVCLMLWAIYKLAIGRFLWSIAVYFFLATYFLASLRALESQPELAKMGLWMYGVLGLFLTVTLLVYEGRRSGPAFSLTSM